MCDLCSEDMLGGYTFPGAKLTWGVRGGRVLTKPQAVTMVLPSLQEPRPPRLLLGKALPYPPRMPLCVKEVL